MINRRKFVSLLTLVFILIVFCFGGTSFGEEDKIEKPKEPNISSGAVYLECLDNGVVLYEKNPDKKINPYSTTKVMTAYLAGKNLDFDKKFVASEKAASIGDSTMNLVAGEELTIEQLLYGLLLPSGNDAAYALGEAISGNIEDFSKLMNETAKKMGANNSHFVNPNGLKDKDHYSTAKDMAIIYSNMLKDPRLVKISGTVKYNMPASNKLGERNLWNTCKVMIESPDIVYSAKTGSWDDENSLVFAFKAGGHKFVASIMNSKPMYRNQDARKLIEYAQNSIPYIEWKYEDNKRLEKEKEEQLRKEKLHMLIIRWSIVVGVVLLVYIVFKIILSQRKRRLRKRRIRQMAREQLNEEIMRKTKRMRGKND